MFAQQLQALNVHVDEEVDVDHEIMTRSNVTKNEALSAVQTDAEAIVQALEVIAPYKDF